MARGSAEMEDLQSFVQKQKVAITTDRDAQRSGPIRLADTVVKDPIKITVIGAGTFGVVFSIKYPDNEKVFTLKITYEVSDAEYSAPNDIVDSLSPGETSHVLAPHWRGAFKSQGAEGLVALASRFSKLGTLQRLLMCVPDENVTLSPAFEEFRCTQYPDMKMPVHIAMRLLIRLLEITAQLEKPLEHGDHMNYAVAHLDFRPENILLCPNIDGKDEKLVMIDFGWSGFVGPIVPRRGGTGKFPLAYRGCAEDRAHVVQIIYVCLVGKEALGDNPTRPFVNLHMSRQTSLWRVRGWICKHFSEIVSKSGLTTKQVNYIIAARKLLWDACNMDMSSQKVIDRIKREGLDNACL